MKIIKLSINSSKESVLRQTPNNDGVWGDYRFIVNEEVDECDYWVVYSKGMKKNEVTKVYPGNMIFIAGEPQPVYHYANQFIENFNIVVAARNDIVHKNIIRSQPAQLWWVGRKIKDCNGGLEFVLGYNDFLQKFSTKKTKILSVISSDKGFTKGHKDRIKFVEKLKEYFDKDIDVYGKGINDFDDKWSVLKDYKYHIVLENYSDRDYWTEKLADCYLCEVFPFYYGCSNLGEYFSDDSYNEIDINNLNASIEVIEKGIVGDLYQKRLNSILEAKNKVLNKYNLLPMICEICDRFRSYDHEKKKVFLRHERSYIDPYKVPMLIKRFYYKYVYK